MARVMRAAWVLAPLLSVAAAIDPASADTLADKMRAEAAQHEAGKRETRITLHAGQPPFELRPNNGYPGTKIKLAIGKTYEIFEKGEYRKKPIRRAIIDWGDGTSSTAVIGGTVATHTYGTRSDNGSISPTTNRDYMGRISFHLDGGDVVTERFRYRLWTNHRGSLHAGGRRLPDEKQDQVWCVNGVREGAYCRENFDVEQTVFQFHGCYDHNYIEFPVANAPIATFNRSGGYRVDPVSNEVAALYGGHFRVLSARGKGWEDNMSGTLYKFTPIQLNDLVPQDGQTLSHITVDSVSARLTQMARSYTSAGFSYGISRQPSEANGWITRVRVEDEGTGGGTPPCPKGRRSNKQGWLKMTVSARITGTMYSLPVTSNEKLPSGYFDQEYYRDE